MICQSSFSIKPQKMPGKTKQQVQPTTTTEQNLTKLHFSPSLICMCICSMLCLIYRLDCWPSINPCQYSRMEAVLVWHPDRFLCSQIPWVQISQSAVSHKEIHWPTANYSILDFSTSPIETRWRLIQQCCIASTWEGER